MHILPKVSFKNITEIGGQVLGITYVKNDDRLIYL